LKPIGVNVLVEKEPRKPLTAGGILIPESLERTPRYGPTIFAKVVGIGGKVQVCKVGDRVALKDVAGDDIMWAGKQFTLLREKDLVGIVT
jgi:co-chaperonin GroES (HSP10)